MFKTFDFYFFVNRMSRRLCARCIIIDLIKGECSFLGSIR